MRKHRACNAWHVLFETHNACWRPVANAQGILNKKLPQRPQIFDERVLAVLLRGFVFLLLFLEAGVVEQNHIPFFHCFNGAHIILAPANEFERLPCEFSYMVSVPFELDKFVLSRAALM